MRRRWEVPLRKKLWSFMAAFLASSCRADVEADLANSLDVTLDAVAGLDGPDPLRRAGEDQIAGLEVVEQGEVGDQLADVPDQLVEVRDRKSTRLNSSHHSI